MRRFLRQALWVALFGLAGGLAYRHFLDNPGEADLGNYLRSAIHGIGLALAGWSTHYYFTLRSAAWLRRFPLALEVAIRAAAMALAVTAVAVLLQATLYGQPVQAAWETIRLGAHLGAAFAASLLIAIVFELTQLVGAGALGNFLLGRYRRPARVERAFLFLDLAGSTALAEAIGELGMQGLLSRVFFDIDAAILAHGGQVQAYVGDEVIVAWPLDRRLKDGRCLACFFAIEAAIAARAEAYRRDFGAVPTFRGGLHAGPVVIAECGSSRRQIAYFGDTMNVAARLLEYGKEAGRRFLVSSDALEACGAGAATADLALEPLGPVHLRGRAAPLAVFAVEPRQDATPAPQSRRIMA